MGRTWASRPYGNQESPSSLGKEQLLRPFSMVHIWFFLFFLQIQAYIHKKNLLLDRQGMPVHTWHTL
jgi:hypothetical protein